MSEQGRSVGFLAALASGLVIGAVEVVLAISFAALIFGGYLASFLSRGIGLYLVAAIVLVLAVPPALALGGTARRGQAARMLPSDGAPDPGLIL